VVRKRQRIVEAAQRLMLQRGPMGVTMESIAAEAGVAKPTLYRYFADREAVIEGVLGTLIAEVEAAFQAGLGTPGSVVNRASAAFWGKHGTVRRMLHGSPHADALYGLKGRGTEASKKLSERLLASMTELLSESGYAEPHRIANILCAASEGLARASDDPATLEADITELVKAVLTLNRRKKRAPKG
jgi:AcrR family transcriptional regulator